MNRQTLSSCLVQPSAPRVQVSLAAFAGKQPHVAMTLAQTASEPLLGPLGIEDVQICPQNHGILDLEYVAGLCQAFPQTRFRLHANARVLPSRLISDWSTRDKHPDYWAQLARVSQAFGARGYTAHAGRRAEASLAQILDQARRAQDAFGCPTGIEGHYPTRDDAFLVSTWEEYRQVFESGVPYAVDLSHLHILAMQSGRKETLLVREMLACERCIEVHVSENDGIRDSHQLLASEPWWWSLLACVNPGAVIFTEGLQSR